MTINNVLFSNEIYYTTVLIISQAIQKPITVADSEWNTLQRDILFEYSLINCFIRGKGIIGNDKVLELSRPPILYEPSGVMAADDQFIK